MKLKPISRGLVLFFLSACLILNACLKADFPETHYSDNLDEVLVSQDFDWKVRAIKQISVIVPTDRVVSIKSADGQFTYSKGMSENKLFVRELTVETFVKTLMIEYQGRTNIISIDQSDDVIHTFMLYKTAESNNNLLVNGNFEDQNYSYSFENNLQSNISSSSLNNWILKTLQNNKPNSEIEQSLANWFLKMTDNLSNKLTFAYYYINAIPNTLYELELNADLVSDLNGLNAYAELAFYSANGQQILGYTEVIDQSGWNAYSIGETSPASTAYIKVVLATSDAGKGEVHFDNVVLTEIIADLDNDGVPDNEDDYPADSLRAFNSFYPGSGYGLLAFEDTWPAKADYDFNDLVLEYRFTLVTNASGFVVDLLGDFSILNVGASYANGFGFQLPDNLLSWFTSVSGVVNNSFETGQTFPTVVVYAVSDQSYQGLNYQVNMSLASNAITESDISIENWNPFLIANGNRWHEIHLPYYEPTDLADVSLFGTNYDDGNPNAWNGNKLVAEKTYLTFANLPWCIDVSSEFIWTLERTPINEGYNYFTSWAISSGSSYADWYLDGGASGTESGYRDNSKLDL
jgi:LruC domain-containing protein